MKSYYHNGEKSSAIKVAFYCMNQKGYSVLHEFINFFGSQNISYVVSCRDKGLKKDFYEDIVKLCKLHNIPFYNRKKLTLKGLETLKTDYRFAIGWKWLISDCTNLIVLHDSLLPRYRGFSPLVNMLVNGEKKIGVTAIKASEEYDKGNIIMQKSLKIYYPITIQQAIGLISSLYARIVIDIYNKLKYKKVLSSTYQKDSLSSYSIWLNKEDYFINWHWSSYKIKRFVDAVGFPYEGARSRYNNGKICLITKVMVEPDVRIEDRKRHIGKIIFFKHEDPVVICGEGLLRLKEAFGLGGGKLKFRMRTKFYKK